MIKLDMSNLGIIDGDQKDALEHYIDKSCFKQRKNYDEYYTDSDAEVSLDISDLMILSEQFEVTVYRDLINLTNKPY